MPKEAELDIKRIQSLSDATFAVAMTILALEIKVPTHLLHPELMGFLSGEIISILLIYIYSFVILGAFWIDSHFHHNMIVKTDRVNSWCNIVFLMLICLVPFSSALLTNYTNESIAIAIYCINLMGMGLAHFLMLVMSWKKGFIHLHISRRLYRNLKIRILVPVAFYTAMAIMAPFFSKWLALLFPVPLIFQIFFGRSKKEADMEAVES